MGPIGSKVIDVKGQIYVFFLLVMFFFSVCSPTPPRSLSRSSPNFRLLARGIHFIKGQGHRGQRSNKVKVIKAKGQIYVFFCLFPYFSQVFGPIFTKLGGKVEGGPRYYLERFIFPKVKVIELKGQISVCLQSLVRFA